MKTRAIKVLFSFIALITVGIILLYYFGLQQNLNGPKFATSLFTAVSAVCVTGLTIIDISTDLNLTGQIILLTLIQAGGLGIFTLTNWMILSLKQSLDPDQTINTSETFGTLRRTPPHKLLRNIVLITLAAESIGALLLFLRFINDYPLTTALWHAIFHSVSAFCNAGFSLFPDSLERYQNDLYVNFIITTEIICGGIGFLVLTDFEHWYRHRKEKKRHRFSLQSKIVLSTTLILIGTGVFSVLLLEWNNLLSKDPFFFKLLKAFFLSVTSRTAGFNTVDTSSLSSITLTILIVLMMIGASPGSTGGGIKTTGAAIFFGILRSSMNRRENVEFYYRTIPHETVWKVLVVIFLYLTTAFLGLIMLQMFEVDPMTHKESRGLFLEHLFEIISALSTVGLSTGITPTLSQKGQLVLISCMFIGRVGLTLLLLSIIPDKKRLLFTYPEEDIMV